MVIALIIIRRYVKVGRQLASSRIQSRSHEQVHRRSRYTTLHQGLNTSIYSVQDLLSTEEWAQEMLGKPVLGIIFLFEINEKQKLHEKAEAEKL